MTRYGKGREGEQGYYETEREASQFSWQSNKKGGLFGIEG